MKNLLFPFFLLIVFNNNAQDQHRSISISADYEYGGFSWVQKYNTELGKELGFPYNGIPGKITFTGYRIGPGVSLLYDDDKWGFGIHYRSYLYEQHVADPSRGYWLTQFANVSEYGAIVRYKLFEKSKFSLNTELSGGIFSIDNNYNLMFSSSYINKLFINPAINMNYNLDKVSFFLSPNYNFMYTNLMGQENETIFKQNISSFNIALGAEMYIFKW